MNDDLRQVDLSGLSLTDMNSAQRAELRRRLDQFVDSVAGKPKAAAPEPPKKIRKWVPGMKS